MNGMICRIEGENTFFQCILVDVTITNQYRYHLSTWIHFNNIKTLMLIWQIPVICFFFLAAFPHKNEQTVKDLQ